MNIKDYLDATYLKTPKEAGVSDSENWMNVKNLTEESIEQQYKCVMIRAAHVKKVREVLDRANSTVLLGTVIDFPMGEAGLVPKLSQATKAINWGADELDFVLDYQEFINHGFSKLKEQLEVCTEAVLNKNKTTKWIIESAALENNMLADLCGEMGHFLEKCFGLEQADKIFLKSSTGYYKPKDRSPGGATLEAIKTMLEFAGPFPVKASGGVRTAKDAQIYIDLGVKRLGTSTALTICQDWKN